MSYDLHRRARQAVAEAGFSIDFSGNELAELHDAPRLWLENSQSPKVHDRRGWLWSSIDNDSSRDLDQVEYAERGAEDSIVVYVGIADVEVFVPQGSALDKRAAHNATSVYTGIETFPMLPRELSEDLSSLLPGKDRLAVVTAMTIAPDGEVTNAKFERALVRNYAKLTYEDVGAWLEEPQKRTLDEFGALPGLREQLLLQHEATTRLQAARERAGALELETTEAVPVVRDGRVVDLQVQHKNPARKIIENFMVTANIATTQFLQAHGRSVIGRVVRQPERWPRIREVARQHGTELPEEPSPQALAAFLERQQQVAPEEYAELSLSIVKLLGPGLYALIRPEEHKGHFGLGAANYTHSTAPNRRYPDLVVQRILKAAIDGQPAPYADEELETIAERCNRAESAAQKVERLMRKVAAAALFGDRIGQVFDAVVTGASAKGVWVRTVRPPVEGRVVRGEAGMDVGERVRVKLVETDIERGFIDFVGV